MTEIFKNVIVFVPKKVRDTICACCRESKFTISTHADFYYKGYKVVCKKCGTIHWHVTETTL